LFGQFGIGDPRVSRFAYYTGSGLTLVGFVPRRDQDELGFAVAAAHNGSPFIESQRKQGIHEKRSEVTLELTYLAQLGVHLAVQPNLRCHESEHRPEDQECGGVHSSVRTLILIHFDFLAEERHLAASG
jgi:carbohydrate-selective porin OprB